MEWLVALTLAAHFFCAASQSLRTTAFIGTGRNVNGSDNNIANPTFGEHEALLLRGPPGGGRAFDTTGMTETTIAAGTLTPFFASGTTGTYADTITSGSTVIDRPSPRNVSNTVCAQNVTNVFSSRNLTDMIWQWGQWLDHDFTLVLESETEIDNIPVPCGDAVFDPTSTGTNTFGFHRSEFLLTGGFRESPNFLTAYIDASNIYGNTDARTHALRSFSNGMLAVTPDVNGDLLPYNTNGLMNGGGTTSSFFLGGDPRVNEQVALAAMHTLWVREHNYWATEVNTRYPGMTDDEIFAVTRDIVIAINQKIHFEDYALALLGVQLPAYAGYVDTCDAGVTQEFATGLYRVGHTQLSSKVLRITENVTVSEYGPLDLREMFFNLTPILNQGGVAPILIGQVGKVAQEIDVFVIDDVRNFLFTDVTQGAGLSTVGGGDLVFLNLQRARDHGLRLYNDARTAFGLTARGAISEISTDPTTVQRLEQAYESNIDLVDVWIGALAEDHVAGGSTGELMFTGILDQLTRARDCDRFYYLNINSTLTLPTALYDELPLIAANTTLADVLSRNLEIPRTSLPNNVFFCDDTVPGGALPLNPVFPTIDQFGNNRCKPEQAIHAAEAPRLLPPLFADGAGSFFDTGLDGVDRPNPRNVSNIVSAQEGNITSARGLTDMIWVFGQFIDHDLSLNPESETETIAFTVPPGDTTFDPSATGTNTFTFHRTIPVKFTGTFGPNPSNPREAFNALTSYVDGSAVYGSEEARTVTLRSGTGGRMLVQSTEFGDLMPFNTFGLENVVGPSTAAADTFFAAGEVRANEVTTLAVMHTLWVREHNYHADRIAGMFPAFTDEEIFEYARLIVMGEIQHITYKEFLPALMGSDFPPYTGYDPSVDSSVTNEFTTGIYRVGHTMLSTDILRLDQFGLPVPEGHLLLRDMFFNLTPITVESGLDPFLRGVAGKVAQEIDSFVVDDVRNLLFANVDTGMGLSSVGGTDLVMLNLLRARDHGLSFYNNVREAYGLTAYTMFSEINPDPEVEERLRCAYGDNIGLVDIWIGAVSEVHVANASVGELMFTALTSQFGACRDGDRFFYENPTVSDRLVMFNWNITNQTLRTVIMRNTNITNLQQNVFFCPNATEASMIWPYRDPTGFNNHPCNPYLGTAGTILLRRTNITFADGIGVIADTVNITNSTTMETMTVDRPNARAVSNNASQQVLGEDIFNARFLTDWVWQWGQFVDHDFALVAEQEGAGAEILDIVVPSDDPVFFGFDFSSSSTVTLTFHRSEFENGTGIPGHPRENENILSHYLDASNVYGSTNQVYQALREPGTCLLRVTNRTYMGNNEPSELLPFNEFGLPNTAGPSGLAENELFVAGDTRSNEQVGLTVIHTLMVREHNYWCRNLMMNATEAARGVDVLFQVARERVIAEVQKITVDDFFVALTDTPLPMYAGFNDSVDPTLTTEFSTAAFRMGHTLLATTLKRINPDGSRYSGGSISLEDAFFSPSLFVEHDIDVFLRGLAVQRAQELDPLIVEDVRSFLFGNVDSGMAISSIGGGDLIVLNIMRGRDHGIPGFNDVRVGFGLTAHADFASISSDPAVVEGLMLAFGDIQLVDPFIGILAEDQVMGSTGETLFTILTDQFSRCRDGDRYWYENHMDMAFIDAVKATTLSDIIARNSAIARADLADDIFFCKIVDFNNSTAITALTPDEVACRVELDCTSFAENVTTNDGLQCVYNFQGGGPMGNEPQNLYLLVSIGPFNAVPMVPGPMSGLEGDFVLADAGSATTPRIWISLIASDFLPFAINFALAGVPIDLTCAMGSPMMDGTAPPISAFINVVIETFRVFISVPCGSSVTDPLTEICSFNSDPPNGPGSTGVCTCIAGAACESPGGGAPSQCAFAFSEFCIVGLTANLGCAQLVITACNDLDGDGSLESFIGDMRFTSSCTSMIMRPNAAQANAVLFLTSLNLVRAITVTVLDWVECQMMGTGVFLLAAPCVMEFQGAAAALMVVGRTLRFQGRAAIRFSGPTRPRVTIMSNAACEVSGGQTLSVTASVSGQGGFSMGDASSMMCAGGGIWEGTADIVLGVNTVVIVQFFSFSWNARVRRRVTTGRMPRFMIVGVVFRTFTVLVLDCELIAMGAAGNRAARGQLQTLNVNDKFEPTLAGVGCIAGCGTVTAITVMTGQQASLEQNCTIQRNIQGTLTLASGSNLVVVTTTMSPNLPVVNMIAFTPAPITGRTLTVMPLQPVTGQTPLFTLTNPPANPADITTAFSNVVVQPNCPCTPCQVALTGNMVVLCLGAANPTPPSPSPSPAGTTPPGATAPPVVTGPPPVQTPNPAAGLATPVSTPSTSDDSATAIGLGVGIPVAVIFLLGVAGALGWFYHKNNVAANQQQRGGFQPGLPGVPNGPPGFPGLQGDPFVGQPLFSPGLPFGATPTSSPAFPWGVQPGKPPQFPPFG